MEDARYVYGIALHDQKIHVLFAFDEITVVFLVQLLACRHQLNARTHSTGQRFSQAPSYSEKDIYGVEEAHPQQDEHSVLDTTKGDRGRAACQTTSTGE